MTEERHDYRCKVTLLLDDVTQGQAERFFDDGIALQVFGGGADDFHDLIATIEDPQPIEVQP